MGHLGGQGESGGMMIEIWLGRCPRAVSRAISRHCGRGIGPWWPQGGRADAFQADTGPLHPGHDAAITFNALISWIAGMIVGPVETLIRAQRSETAGYEVISTATECRQKSPDILRCARFRN